MSVNTKLIVEKVIEIKRKIVRGRSRTAAISKVELFVIIVNNHPLSIITKSSNLDVAAVLDPLLIVISVDVSANI